MISNTQVDKLGDRLRQTEIAGRDIRLLDQYRRSFIEAYSTVIGIARDRLHLKPTGRPAKSTSSIIAKLQRESIRLSQVQDIAGCRIVVPDMIDQDRVVESLVDAFHGAVIVDRRAIPQFGYRAVHIIVRHGVKTVEIQVRTRLQHLWAELSEKWADVVDPAVKYGGGPEPLRRVLLKLSQSVAECDELERSIRTLPVKVRETQEGRDLESRVQRLLQEVHDTLASVIKELENRNDLG